MGYMKELFIDLQNEFGLNLENMPEDFSMEDFLKEKSEEIVIKKEEKRIKK